MRAARAALAAVALLGACDKRAPLASCHEDLSGTYRTDSGARWSVIDRGPDAEVYPLFDDTTRAGAPAGAEVSPRVIDLARRENRLDGDVKRRFVVAGNVCPGKAAVHLLSCAGETLELVLADPPTPIAFAPCQSAPPEPSHRERWTRE